MNYWRESKDHIYVAAHRGWCSVYPENTMEAFKAAAELGVDQLETDIRISKDGELVLIHDETVDRTTDGSGLVIEKTLAELKALDAGSHKGEQFKGCQIPTLREFMEYVKTLPEMTLDLELKEYPVEGHEEIAYSVCDRVLAMVEEYGFAERVVINTFHGGLHDYIQEKYGNRYRQHVYYPTKVMWPSEKDPYSYAFCCCMFGDYIRREEEWQAAIAAAGGKENLSKEQIDKYEQFENMASPEEFAWMAEKRVEPWAGACVRDERTVDMAIERGAALITCNNPDVVLQLLREKGKR